MTRPELSWILLALGVFLLAAPAGAQSSVKVEAKVFSRRAQRAHLELKSAFKSHEARLAPNQTIKLQLGEGEPIQAKLLAVSSRYLVVELPAEVELPEGALWVVGQTKPPPEGALPGEAPAGSDVRVGRRAPSLSTFRAEPPPERELVPFRGGRQATSASGGKGGEGKPEDWTDQPRVDKEGNELTRSGRIANEVRGEVMVGVDTVADDEADVTRITPYTRLRFEVRQLGGSDRMTFRFFGSIRRPFDADFDDWTGERVDKENARLGSLSLTVESELPEHIRSFSDRVEAGIGRDIVPAVTEAGLIDGVRFGLRFGPVTPFMFGGFAVSNNPRIADYDSLIYGGGIKLDHAFSHSGALRFSVAAAQERFRGEGERDFVEAQAGLRLGSFGLNGILVVDLFDTIKDDPDTRLTTGQLSAYAQISRAVRVEAGYRERRAQWQAELLALDLLQPQIASLDRSARRNAWALIRFRLLDDLLDLWLRGEHYESRNSREANGGALGVSLRFNRKHRLMTEFSLRRRYRSDSEGRTTNDPYLLLSYMYTGESLMAQLSIGYRDSFPESVHDRRIAFRLLLDYEIGAGFGVRAYGEADFRRAPIGDDGTATYAGVSARYRF